MTLGRPLNRAELSAIKVRSILRIGARHHTTQHREPANRNFVQEWR